MLQLRFVFADGCLLLSRQTKRVEEASGHFLGGLKERIFYVGCVLEFSEPVDSEVDGRVWVQAYPLLNAIGGYAFEQQAFESYFFEGFG